MEITGKIIVALPETSGTSKAGNPWRKREYVLETQETYPKKVYFSFFGDRADQYPLAVGDQINLSFDIDSREYNGRWYVEIRPWKAEKLGAGAAAPVQPQQNFGPAPQMPGGYPQTGAPVPPPAVAPDITMSSNDDLPF